MVTLNWYSFLPTLSVSIFLISFAWLTGPIFQIAQKRYLLLIFPKHYSQKFLYNSWLNVFLSFHHFHSNQICFLFICLLLFFFKYSFSAQLLSLNFLISSDANGCVWVCGFVVSWVISRCICVIVTSLEIIIILYDLGVLFWTDKISKN